MDGYDAVFQRLGLSYTQPIDVQKNLRKNGDKSLIIFFWTGCGHCKHMIIQAEANFKQFIQKMKKSYEDLHIYVCKVVDQNDGMLANKYMGVSSYPRILIHKGDGDWKTCIPLENVVSGIESMSSRSPLLTQVCNHFGKCSF